MPQVRTRAIALAGVLATAAFVPTLGTAPALAAPPTPSPSPPTNLLFSEYVEGTGNNKALEIFNGTGAPIDLGASSYGVQMYFNGSTTVGTTIGLTGTVADGEVFVLAQASASATILAVADQTSTASWFNGDDAVVLVQGPTVVDGIGQVGFDPGTEWGSGVLSTADNTLRRQGGVSAGDTDTSDVFDPTVQWLGFATDAFDGLGAHALGGGDTPPVVTATTPGDGVTTPVAPTVLEVTFDEPVTVDAGAVTLTCTVSGPKSVTASAGSTVTLTPSSPIVDGDSCTLTVPADAVTDDDTLDPPDGLAGELVVTFTIADPCQGPFTPIPAIQGAGPASPLAGTIVTTRGVVVSDNQGSSNLNGFFLQDAPGDADPLTSDGIFVFGGASAVSIGDVVRVTGPVVEFNTLTEISGPTEVVACGTAAPPAATVVTLPETVDGDLERYEAMLVSIPQPLTVQQNFFQGRFGQVTLGSGGRLFQPTNEFPAGSPAAVAQAGANARRLLVLDDGRTAQNPSPIPYIGEGNTLRAGDTVSGLEGVLDHGPINASVPAARDYRLHPTVAPSFERTNPRTAAPEPVGGNLKVASFNVLNFFTTLSQRGANTPLELQRQTDKLVAAITAIDADVVGVIEIENNGPVAIGALVDALNAVAGAGTYAAIADPTDGVGTDAIKVGLLYQPARVTPVGAAASLALPATFERFPVAQTFELAGNGEQASVVINHFKSKSCDGATGANIDQGDGQGCFNPRRVTQAQALGAFVQQLATVDPDVIVLGDLNAYAKEDPIAVLLGTGLTDLVDARLPDAYSFVFDGQSGYLDHALATGSAAAQVTGTTEWHINADEPSVIDYNLEFKTQDLYAPTPYRSSDHDPVVVGLTLGACRFSDNSARRVRMLQGSCSTPTTIVVPNGWTLDGGGHTISAYDDEGDHFRGAVIANAGAVANVRNVVVTGFRLADVCDTGADRLRGVRLSGASGSVTATKVLDLHQGGASTCQEGVGIEAANAPFARGGRDRVVAIIGNEVRGAQLAGIVVNGSVAATVNANRVQGSGPTAALAQRGVQVGFGASAVVALNAISAHDFPGAEVACGVLIVEADSVGQQANRYTANEQNVCTLGTAFTPDP